MHINRRRRTTALIALVGLCACNTARKVVSEGDRATDVAAAEVASNSTKGNRESSGFGSSTKAREGLDSAMQHRCLASPHDPDSLFDEANQSYRAGDFHGALACVELAAERLPGKVTVQHLRATSLAALGRYSEAQTAFALALALDPQDPQTLADVADFYINILPPTQRFSLETGLVYARDGHRYARERREADVALSARLLHLQAQVLNDLGRPNAAMAPIEAALAETEELPGGEHELAVALFGQLRFDEAKAVFERVLASEPGSAYTHYYLGLIAERKGQTAHAEAHFELAASLAPEQLFPPLAVDNDEFAEVLSETLAALDAQAQSDLKEVRLQVVDLPTDSDLRREGEPFSPQILGLYRGPAKTDGTLQADRRISLYRKNIVRLSRTRSELAEHIRGTLVHELAHYRGFDEPHLRHFGLE